MPRIPNATRMGWSHFGNDMFGRVKVSNSQTVFDSSNRYTSTGQYSFYTASGGSSTFSANESLVDLDVTTASGSKVTAESFKVGIYQPGKALQTMQSFVMNASKQNLRQRIGYYSKNNGVYFEQHHDKYYLVLRSYVTGEIVETRVEQKDWNVENFLGDGPTDVVLDFSKAQILWMEFEWLGVGSVRIGFVHHGVFLVAHQFNHANIISSTYMTTASLPFRFEIENTGVTESSSKFKQVCSSIQLNGSYDKKPNLEIATRDAEVNMTTDLKPLIALRLAEGRTDAIVMPGPMTVFPTAAANYEYSLILNPTTLTGGTWTAYGRGNAEYNTGVSAISGGTVMRQGFFTSEKNVGSSQADLIGLDRFDLQLGRTNSDLATVTSDVIVLCCRTLSGTGKVVASMGWYNLI